MDQLQQAQEWLAANPNDPRAPAVRAKIDALSPKSAISPSQPDPATLKGNLEGLGTAAKVGLPLAAGLATGGMGFVPAMLATTGAGVAGGAIDRDLHGKEAFNPKDMAVDAAMNAGPALLTKGLGMAGGALLRGTQTPANVMDPGVVRSLLTRATGLLGGLNAGEKARMLGKTGNLTQLPNEVLDRLKTVAQGRPAGFVPAAQTVAGEQSILADTAGKAARGAANAKAITGDLASRRGPMTAANEAVDNAVVDAAQKAGLAEDPLAKAGLGGLNEFQRAAVAKQGGLPAPSVPPTVRQAGYENTPGNYFTGRDPAAMSAHGEQAQIAQEMKALGRARFGGLKDAASAQGVADPSRAADYATNANTLDNWLQGLAKGGIKRRGGDIGEAAVVAGSAVGAGPRHAAASLAPFESYRPSLSPSIQAGAAKAGEAELMARGLGAADPVIRQTMTKTNYPAVTNQGVEALAEWLGLRKSFGAERD